MSRPMPVTRLLIESVVEAVNSPVIRTPSEGRDGW